MDTDPLPTPSLTVNLSILLQRVIEFHAPDSWLSWALIVGVALLCLCMSAFVSGSEIAFFGLTPQDIEELEENKVIGFPDIMEKYRAQGYKVGVYPVSEDSWMDMGQLEELEDMRRRLENR